MSKLERKAYDIWCNQRLREGVEYSSKDFIYWYVQEFRKRKWKRAHVGRKDRDRPYSFGNIEMQEQLDNNRERNLRRGNPGRSHRAVVSTSLSGDFLGDFPSKVEAANFYGCDPKTIYNHCQGKTKTPFKHGRTNPNPVRFAWKK